jgi:HTH-type transcriptional regulator/antitoxin HipB
MQINSLRDLVATVRGRRLDLGLSQAEVARRAQVSRQWVGALEAGKPTAEIGLLIRVLDALELGLELNAPNAGSSDSWSRDSLPHPADLDELIDQYRGG